MRTTAGDFFLYAAPMSSFTPSRFLRAGALVLALPALAHAHPGHEVGDGLLAGFTHPLTGFDHLLAMLAVGLWAAQLGGRARWAVPVAFVSVMTFGAVLGAHGWSAPAAEPIILASVLAFGLLIATAARVPIALAAAAVGAFAFFHGLAHGAEMPATATGLLYGTGFVAATAALHLTGLLLGQSVQARSTAAAQVAGGAIALAGVALLLG